MAKLNNCQYCDFNLLGRHEIFCPLRVVSELPKINTTLIIIDETDKYPVKDRDIGWICPQCHSIMSPKMKGCINCNQVQTLPMMPMQTRSDCAEASSDKL
jgi:hypothetical protein